MNNNVFGKLLAFLDELEENNLAYTLAHCREDAVMASVAMPGERWEVEFFSDGSVEVERFVSNGEICGEDVLSELFAKFGDAEIINDPDALQNETLVTIPS